MDELFLLSEDRGELKNEKWKPYTNYWWFNSRAIDADAIFLFTDLPEKEWNEFVRDLVYKNRFSSSHKVEIWSKIFLKDVQIIKEWQDLCCAIIYENDPLREFLSGFFKNSDMKLNDDFNIKRDDDKDWDITIVL